MRKLRAVLRRLAELFRKEQRDLELDQEIQSNLQLDIDENLRTGMTVGEARRRALVRFGSIEATKEIYRRQRGFPLLESLIQDLKYASRTLRRSPGFSATALISLALGIGANSAIFTAANAAMWRTLPVSDPQSLALITAVRDGREDGNVLPVSLVEELVRSSNVFSSAIIRDDDGLSFSIDGGRAERIVGQAVSGTYFTFFGIRPILGRGFSDEVQQGHWAAEVVLSYRFWQRRFAGNPNVLGQTIRLNGYPFTIVGVTPPEFYGEVVGYDSELSLPLMPRGQKISIILASTPSGQITARLKPGVTIAQAEAACEPLFQQYLHDNPTEQSRNNPFRRLRIAAGDKGWHQFLNTFREPFFILLGLSGLVLLIACTNMANMLIARATARQRELSIRSAIGAGRGRLVRQMLVESLLLSCLGGGLGLAAAFWTGKAIFAFFPQGHIATVFDLSPDMRVVWFTVGITMLSGIFSSLIPALKSTSGNLAVQLKSDSAASVGSQLRTRFRKMLVVGQIALSLVLLAVAGMFVRMLGQLHSVNTFPQADRVFLFTMKPQRELYDEEKKSKLTAEVLRRMSLLPGVQQVALAEDGPLGSRQASADVKTFTGQSVRAAFDEVSQGYFNTVGMPIISGRDFSPMDSASSAPVVIVDEVMAKELFNSENPIGKKIFVDDETASKAKEIVGVVRATHYYDLHEDPAPLVFENIQQMPPYMPTLHVRATSGSAGEIVNSVRREFDSIDKGFPVFNIKTLQDRIDDSLAKERLIGDLAGVFGLLALALSVVGIYGITSYSVGRQTREIGVRMALGATPTAIRGMILKESLMMVVIGTGIGFPTTLAAGQLISRWIAKASVVDPISLTGASIILVLVALIAGYIPAWRAARIDPQVAMRSE